MLNIGTLVGLDFILDHPSRLAGLSRAWQKDHWQLPSLSLFHFTRLVGPVSEIITSNRTFKQIFFVFGLDSGRDIDSQS